MLKVIAITKPPKYYYRIGENFNNCLWYSFENIKDGADYSEVKTGDMVEIEHTRENNENILTSIKVVGKAPAKTETTGWRSKSVEESESIRKQAVGKMVPEAMKGMDLTGKTVDEVLEVVTRLYNKFNELTK